MIIKAKITKKEHEQLQREANENNINIEIMASRALKTWLRAMKIKKGVEKWKIIKQKA